MRHVLRMLVVFTWMCLGVYVALAGFFAAKLFETTSIARMPGGRTYLTYGDLSFRTRQDLQDFLLDETASRWFTWLPDVPAELMPLLACSAWGIFGAAVQIAYLEVYASQTDRLSFGKLLLSPVLGAGVALGIYLLAFILPAVLTIGPHTMRAETLVALSFISGLGHQRVFEWVRSQIDKLVS